MDSVLILTLWLEPEAHAHLTALRRAHFPPERNFLEAHITLFHALPGEHEAEVRRTLEAVCAATPGFSIELPSVYSLGRGVALEVRSPELLRLRGELARRWKSWLTPQDKQGYKPHVTVQNKVSAEEARALYTRLSNNWEPMRVGALGLELWRYLGGPWERLEGFEFAPGGDYASPSVM